MVVTRDVEVGELLFADKALSICGKAALLQQTVERLKHCSKAESAAHSPQFHHLRCNA